jgi:ERCC4-type nuclease
VSISLDYRTGSKELAPLFVQYGIQVQVKALEFGDLAWEGNGPKGRCSIVVERKRIEDLIQSMESHRLSGHQLPGMAEAYDYCYLLVEGIWRPGPQGEMQIGHGSFEADRFGGRWMPCRSRLQHRSIDNYLATLELHAGVIYRRTLSPQETVAVIVDLYRWWNEKQWAAHSSHLGVYAPASPSTKGRFSLVRRKVSVAEKMIMQLPELDAKARRVAEHFGTAKVMANATEAEWVAIKGVGKVTARKAVEALNARVG